MGAYSGVGAYLASSGSEVGDYSGGGLNQSFTVCQYIFAKNLHFLAKIVPLLQAIVWEVC